nr:zinc finger, CCHC-type [Tanacetum cinerariifolium]
MNYLRVWGCRAVVRLPYPKLRTLGKRGIECIFVGYDERSKAFSTIRLLIIMASIHNLIIDQMDTKIAFLNGELDEETPKQWHQKFDKILLSNGYLLNQADKCVYSKFDETGKGVIICLYVDDMLIGGTDQVQVDLTKEFLSSRFFMKDMREADVILVSTPMDTNEKLIPNNGLKLITIWWMATKFVGKKSEWLRNLILKILLWSKPTSHISILCGSVATLEKAYSQIYNGKSRHLGIRHSMIYELIMNGVVSIEFVKSQQSLADYLMKRQARDLVIKSVEVMGLKSC